MVIFHSYVSLPEGNLKLTTGFFLVGIPSTSRCSGTAQHPVHIQTWKEWCSAESDDGSGPTWATPNIDKDIGHLGSMSQYEVPSGYD